METVPADARSGFDRFFASTRGQEDLSQRLEMLRRQQQEATPEPSSSDHESVEEDHKWQCDILHDHFEPSEVDTIRDAIWQADYWRIECQHYANVLEQLLLQRSGEQAKGGKPTAQQWRTAALEYKRLLRLKGLSLNETTRIRRSIKSQKYWEQELDILQQRVALLEREMHEAARAKKRDIQHRRQERVRRCLQAIGDLSPLPLTHTSTRGLPHEGSVATRTRSRTTIGGGVSKHTSQRAKAGAKATNHRTRRAPQEGNAPL